MNSDPFHLEEQPACPLCAGHGRVLYEGLPDRVYGSPGKWRFRRCAAAHCGALWIDPRPDRATIGAAYTEYYTHQGGSPPPTRLHRFVAKIQRAYWARAWGYDRADAGPWAGLAGLGGLLPAFHPGLRAYLDFAVMYLPADKRGRLLDVGCGNGDTLARLAGLGWTVSGIDTDEAAVQAALSRGLDARKGELRAQDWSDDPMDAVTLSHVIEHVHDPVQLLERCLLCLKPGGRLVAVTPNADAWMHRRAGRDWLGLDPPRHLCLFTVRALADAASRAGFRGIQVRSSVREANVQYIAAKRIAATGRYVWGDRGSPVQRLAGQVVQYVEPTLITLRKAEGEELVLTATR
jgi:2-polyprenyl-3-methyl-5-hydroxy-6-metoxy-1,4-benzoquinol methylase